jgi:putative DNA methylase
MELAKDIDSDEVLAHLRLNIPNYYGDEAQREFAVELADYLAKQLVTIRPAKIICSASRREAIPCLERIFWR